MGPTWDLVLLLVMRWFCYPLGTNYDTRCYLVPKDPLGDYLPSVISFMILWVAGWCTQYSLLSLPGVMDQTLADITWTLLHHIWLPIWYKGGTVHNPYCSPTDALLQMPSCFSRYWPINGNLPLGDLWPPASYCLLRVMFTWRHQAWISMYL